MKYQWIFFDADDTLFDFTKSAHHALSCTLQHFEIKTDPVYFQTYKEINNEVWGAFERNEITASELRLVRFEKFMDAIGEYRDPAELSRFYLQELSQTDFMVDGARALVEEFLEKGHRLCLITNGLTDVQRPRIQKVDFGKYFESIVVSDEIGIAKPDAGFFEHAFSEIGRPAKEEVIVVGDSLNSDIQGGNNFGLDTCWYNPSGSANHTKHLPTYEIDRIGRLREIVF